jgi:Zn-dependent metalloprotease
MIRFSTFLLCGFLLLFTQISWAQLKVNRKPPAQQKTSEQENAMQSLQEAMDPEALIKQLDQQLNLLKKQGMATPEMIREIEKAKEEIRKEFGGTSKTSEPAANVPESVNEPSRPAEQTAPAEQEVAYDLQRNPASEVPLFMRFYQEAAMTATKFQEWMAQRYGVGLLVTDSLHQAKGLSYVHFEQIMDGFPVEGTRFTFTPQSQSGAFATGMAYAPFSKKNEGTLTLAQAFQKVKNLYPGQALQIGSQGSEDDFAVPIPLGTCRDLGRAWVAKTTENPQHEFWLCYRFYVVKTDEKIYIDVQSGEVLRREHTMLECLPTIPARTEPGVGVAVRVNTLFYGAQNITVLKKDTSYLLADPTKPRIAVFFKDSIQNNWWPFYDKTNSWREAATRASGALDVHWAYRQTVNYYQSRFNWVGLGKLDQDIHIMYEPDYPGAAYVPSEKRFQWGRISPAAVDEMAGSMGWLAGGRSGWIKGALGSDKPFASLDVCAHEFTHGVVENVMGGLQRSGQPGALNEALADVMAAAVEAAVDPMGSNPWIIAEKLFTGTGIRNLAKPKSSSTRTQPDTFEGDFWIETTPECNQENDRCGTHVNSGVIARWFYLICNGGMGTNDFDDKYSLKEGEQVTTEEAAQLIFQTIPLLHPTSDFEYFSDLTIEVAKNLFGKCSKKARAVEYAWYAVGIREDPPARCGDWTFDMVVTADGETTTIHYFLKEDRMVIVPQADDNPGKMFSSLQSSLMTVVSRNDDGSIENHTLPKNIMKYTLEKFDEAMPAANEEVRKSIADDRRAIAAETDPAERAHMQRELNQKIAIWDKMQNQDLPALRQTMQEASSIPVMTESQFYGANSSKSRRKAKREFDKKYKQGTGEIEGFEAKHFAFDGHDWWSTYEIPLHLSDLIFTLPVSFQKNMGPAVDHFMRGFPLRLGSEMKITNIKNKAPANFEQLYSASPVFR